MLDEKIVFNEVYQMDAVLLSGEEFMDEGIHGRQIVRFDKRTTLSLAIKFQKTLSSVAIAGAQTSNFINRSNPQIYLVLFGLHELCCNRVSTSLYSATLSQRQYNW